MEKQTIIKSDLDIMCKQAVQHLRNLTGFQLYEENEFIKLVYFRCQKENIQGPESIFQNTALNIYAEGLYQAVGSKDNFVCQEIGFQELSKYLYRMAYNFYFHQSLDIEEVVDKAQECTQMALERIYLHIESVKSPGAFLKWCGMILRNICLEDVRSRKVELSLDNEEIEISSDDRSLYNIESKHDRECLITAILRLKEEYRRVIKLTFFSENETDEKMSDEEIANELKINIGNLYTIRSRALSALRKDKKLLGCMQDQL
jgi:RNA polymerase sigma factor (sigma-70 family)